MSQWWHLYQTKFSRVNNKASITKDEVEVLAERLEFFLPRFSDASNFLEGILYIAGLTLLIVTLKVTCHISGPEGVSWHGELDWFLLLGFYALHFISIITTTTLTFILIDLQREVLKKKSFFEACVRILATMMVTGACVVVLSLILVDILGFSTFTFESLLYELVIFEIFGVITACAIIIYYWHDYKALKALHLSFEYKLNRLNEHIQARIAPHFLFNTLNTLSWLIETDKNDANDMLQHVSHIMRTRFDEPTEISLEEEIKICQHYLAIESYRLQDKLIVNWHLPDDETINDMSITSLTLQTVLEQTVRHVVETTTEPVVMSIDIKWSNHIVMIDVSAEVSKNAKIDRFGVANEVNFRVQEEYLKEYFGESANISMRFNANKLVTAIQYQLHDVLIR